MTLTISDSDLDQAALRYHELMVDRDEYTAPQVRAALVAYLGHVVNDLVYETIELEFERPEAWEACLQEARK